MDTADTNYFERRAEEERTAAAEAADERAAQSHRELAEEYRKLASGEAQQDLDDGEPEEAGIFAREFRIVP